MPTKVKKQILTKLFNEGVLVAEKDRKNNHPDFGVPNLYVMQLMKSMKSRTFVNETFCWHHFYWYLTNEGIDYLRAYLHLPLEIVPLTLKKKNKPEEEYQPPQGRGGRSGKYVEGESFGFEKGASGVGRGKQVDQQQEKSNTNTQTDQDW